jgi:hypothetical protein
MTDEPGTVEREPVRAPCFLVGSERSGTTLLRLMLDHHPDIAFDKEFDFTVTMVSDTGQLPPVEKYVKWVVTVRGMSFEVDPSLSYLDLVHDFLQQKRAASKAKAHVGATVHREFERLRFLWPTARYIHLVRDPRDVARSVVQKGWAGNVYHAAEFWLDAERSWDTLAPHLSDDRAIEVRYEDLVTDPERTLTAICRFIGVPYSLRMLDYSADAPQYPPPDPRLVAQWRTKLEPRDVALVEIRTGALLENRGYVASGYSKPRIGRVRHELLLNAGRVKRLVARAHTFGPVLVTLDVIARRTHLASLESYARIRMNAIEQRMVDEEAAGSRTPSPNIAPSSRER